MKSQITSTSRREWSKSRTWKGILWSVDRANIVNRAVFARRVGKCLVVSIATYYERFHVSFDASCSQLFFSLHPQTALETARNVFLWFLFFWFFHSLHLRISRLTNQNSHALNLTRREISASLKVPQKVIFYKSSFPNQFSDSISQFS